MRNTNVSTAQGTSGLSDEQLVERVRGGSDEAWAALLERHSELLLRQATHLAQAAGRLTAEDRSDEASEMYLFLAERVRHSLRTFAGRCKLRTWIIAVIGNRAHVLKAWIRQKDPSRAEIRIPTILRHHAAVDHEIFRRLVWGLDPHRVALELSLPEHDVRQVEELVVQHSPRVAARIRANRLSRSAPLRLDWVDDEQHERLQLADPAGTPQQMFERDEGLAVIDEELQRSLQELPPPERRLLFLLYDQQLTVTQIARLAASQPTGMQGLDDANHCYYLKDRALQGMADAILQRLRRQGHTPRPVQRRWLLRCVEDLLRSRGVPMAPSNSERGDSVPLTLP